MSGNRNMRIKSPNKKKNSNGSSSNGHLSELDIFMANREARMMEIYGREWTLDEIEELRRKIEQGNAEANKVRRKWGLI